MKQHKKMKKMTHLMERDALQKTCSVLDRKGEKWLNVFVVSDEVTNDACVRKHCPNTLPFKRIY